VIQEASKDPGPGDSKYTSAPRSGQMRVHRSLAVFLIYHNASILLCLAQSFVARPKVCPKRGYDRC